jgi:hypothetical protein
MVCASEKYASEIEIFTFGRGFKAQISRSSVQKRRFHWSMTRQFWMTDFFNRIGQMQTVGPKLLPSKSSQSTQAVWFFTEDQEEPKADPAPFWSASYLQPYQNSHSPYRSQKALTLEREPMGNPEKESHN